jgi:signal transduction histidine kinase
MTALERVVLLVISDAAVTQQLIGELVRDGARYQLPIATSLAQARSRLRRIAPLAILLDESAVLSANGDPGRDAIPLDAAVRELAEVAPLVLVVAPERQRDLEPFASLVRQGRLDIVTRGGNFLPLAVGLLERYVASRDLGTESEEPAATAPHTGVAAGPMRILAGRAAGSEELFESPEFGEILRHEVNNPLTGILGNAELLLSRRDRLPSAAVQRLETIAALAVRLRETVRRLSNAWEENHHRIRSA